MLENMQGVEGVSKWIFPAIGYGIKKFCNADTYRISAIIYEPLSRFQGTKFQQRFLLFKHFDRVRKFDSSAYFDIHVHVFKNIKKNSREFFLRYTSWAQIHSILPQVGITNMTTFCWIMQCVSRYTPYCPSTEKHLLK